MAGRPRQFEDSSYSARSKRSREALKARGGRQVMVRLDPEHVKVIEAYKAQTGCSDSEAIRHLLLNP